MPDFWGLFFYWLLLYGGALRVSPQERVLHYWGVYSPRGIPKGAFGPHKMCILNSVSHKIMSEIIEVPVQG